ncbi:MAG: hypothetical protein RBT59_12070 [Arcobacteraceae bacterium]|jgi:hypothetical protein|nr:hypothetical protein [Arcobacteraceae bacterium]
MENQTNQTNYNGIIAALLTIFLGFLGTLLSRLVISKEPSGNVAIHTILHFVATLLIMVPIVGILIWLGVTIYYTIQNYKLTTK